MPSSWPWRYWINSENMAKTIFFSVGDSSADLHASNIVLSLKGMDGDIKVCSAGGSRLKSVSDEFLYDIAGLDVHGYYEPFRQYFRLRDVFFGKIIPFLKNKKPDMVVLADYYGFNIRVAEAAKELGIPVYYFISPQVWATRPGRIWKIKKYVDRMLVIFPFEEQIYRDAGIPVTFVGHPLLDILPRGSGVEERGRERVRIGLFPGSRKQVIKWNLPVLLESAELIGRQISGAEFSIMGISTLKGCYGNSVNVVYDAGYEDRRNLDLALSTSGTVTLENALLKIPMIVMYRLPALMYFIIKSMARVSQISIVNLIAGRPVIPEFIQDKAEPRKIADLAAEWLGDPGKTAEIREEYARLPALLGNGGAVEKAAKIIAEGIS